MNPTITAINPKGDKGAALILLSDESQVWTPDIAKAQELLKVGSPIPDDWTRKESTYGPQALPPRPKSQSGGKREYVPAFHQTAEGVVYEQERIDRRTALMQAVACWQTAAGIDPEGIARQEQYTALGIAEGLYDWLRATQKSPTPSLNPSPSQASDAGAGLPPAPAQSSAPVTAANGAESSPMTPDQTRGPGVAGADSTVAPGGEVGDGEAPAKPPGVATYKPCERCGLARWDPSERPGFMLCAECGLEKPWGKVAVRA